MKIYVTLSTDTFYFNMFHIVYLNFFYKYQRELARSYILWRTYNWPVRGNVCSRNSHGIQSAASRRWCTGMENLLAKYGRSSNPSGVWLICVTCTAFAIARRGDTLSDSIDLTFLAKLSDESGIRTYPNRMLYRIAGRPGMRD